MRPVPNSIDSGTRLHTGAHSQQQEAGRSNRMSARWVHFSAFLAFALCACGRVGAPLPPFIRIPEAVKDLAVSQSGYNLILTWTNPPRFIDGSGATNLTRVQISTGGAVVTTVAVNGPGQPQTYVMPFEPEQFDERVFTLAVETAQGKVSIVSNAASITPVEVPGRIS